MHTPRLPMSKLVNLGNYFGYPECCIASFVKTVSTVTGPWAGSGFVPCPVCAQFITSNENFIEFVKQRITPHRSCPQPFPHDNQDPVTPQELFALRGLFEEYNAKNP